jgi:acyl-coenzyme A thioesterase PaaI-like protein
MSDRAPDASLSAGQLAELLGGDLIDAAAVPGEWFELADRVRELVDAVVVTDVASPVRAEAADQIAAVTRRLRVQARDQPILLVRHPDGRVENLTQAGSGRLNPKAPQIDFVDLPPEPARGTDPSPVEIRAHVILTAADGGSPGRAFGGVVATILDQVLGIAARAAGASGLTASLTVEFRRPTPLGVSLEVAARYTGHEGRRASVTGELRADGVVVAEAKAVVVTDV